MTTIGIIEDDVVIREGLRAYLNRQTGFTCSTTADSLEQFLDMRKDDQDVQIILLDIGLPGISGLEGLRLLKRTLPKSRVIMSTGSDESTFIFRSFNAGAMGYLLKNNLFAEVLSAVASVAEGNAYLSPIVTRTVVNFFNAPQQEEIEITSREKQIVQCLVEGLSYKLIADRLDISLDTVRFHLKNLYKKLRVNSKSEVVSKALKGNLITA